MVDSIGTAQLAAALAPVLSVPHSDNTQAVALPDPTPAQPAITDQVNLSPQAAQQPAQPKVEYANPEVLGTEAVTMYMVNGQLYTRYRDEITNKVTYVPQEAEVVSSGGGSGDTVQNTVNITA